VMSPAESGVTVVDVVVVGGGVVVDVLDPP
jgi:hypothetical protein